MDQQHSNTDTPATESSTRTDVHSVDMGVTFLTSLFAPEDIILFRPTESWTEDGKKRSRVDFQGTCYPRAEAQELEQTVERLVQRSEANRTNVFFGVCPRRGGNGKYDRAWQIGVVRCLWADLDNTAVDDALTRCGNQELPLPSVVVHSGNGVHVYWLLAEPYWIDDGPEPPAVETDWVVFQDGKKRPHKFVVVNGARVDIDVYERQQRLTSKAQQFQGLLAGIAAAIGGDHTTDLSRLLRVPGTQNRKNERNGATPKPAVLVECEPTRQYALDAFARFEMPRSSSENNGHVAVMPLPSKQRLTASKKDTLAELIATSAFAPVGARSGHDFAVCCYAIELGISRDAFWPQVSQVGKFAERGRSYFDLTWDKSEFAARTRSRARVETRLRHDRSNSSCQISADDATRPDSVRIAAEILAVERFAQDAGGRVYHYANGIFQPKGDRFIRRQVKRITDRRTLEIKWGSRLADEVVEYIRVDAPELWEHPPTDLVNVQNGLLDINTGELLPHTPDHLCAIQLPVKFNAEADCPKPRSFVEQVFPPDAIQLAWQLVGCLMVPGQMQETAILLLGDGANGKSTLLRLLLAFLGRRNICSLPLHRLESDKFAAVRLYGKLANICPDLPSEHLSSTATFKAITGGDVITGEYKFQDSFDFEPFSRLVFSANQPPKSHDPSPGFFRRWLVVPFTRSFAVKEQIPREVLDARLADPGELSGLHNLAIQGLRQVRSQGGLANPDSVQEAFEDFRAVTDSLAVWLDTHAVSAPTAIVAKADLRTAFNAAQNAAGCSPMTHKAFGTAIKLLRPNLDEKQRKFAGRIQWC